MKLPSLEHPDAYVGLYVVDFGETCSVGYTGEEVARLLESEAYADAKVYRIHNAKPDGTMELRGVSRMRFELEAGVFFYSRDLPSARTEYEHIHALAEASPLPCRARLFLGGFREETKLRFVVGLAFPAEYDEDISSWLLAHEVTAGERADGGVARLAEVYSQTQAIDSCQLHADPAVAARGMDELLASVGEPIQRMA